MVRKRFDKKGQEGALSYRYLLKILLVAAIAIALFFILRSIGNEVLPK
jgi:hypothetical protein